MLRNEKGILMNMISKKFASLIIAVTMGMACNTDPLTDLPDFNILLLDSTTVMQAADIREGRPIVLIHFDPDCLECQKETKLILSNMDTLKRAQFYFLSTQKLASIKEYSEYYKMGEYSNITVGQDYKDFFQKHFRTRATPFIAVYSQKKET